MKDRFTLTDFIERYPNEEACLEELKNSLFPNGITCKKCNEVTPHYRIKSRRCYSCQNCGTQTYPLAGTIFEKSTTPLFKWFYAMFLMVHTRSGISAKQLEREIGVTYKTAWRMFKHIRMLMTESGVLDGTVEIDETYIGGKGKSRRWKISNPEDKQVLMGMVKREGKVYLKHIPNSGKYHLVKQITENVDPKARIITDEWRAYKNLKEIGYKHDVITHKTTYVNGDIHTQSIENVWSHLKRGLYGVYRQVSKKYLQAYADEYAFRYNYRGLEGKMFDELLNRVTQVRSVKI